MKKVYQVSVLIAIIILSGLVSNPALANQDGVNLEYIVSLEQNNFDVEVKVENNEQERVIISFPDSWAGVDNLSNCISNFTAVSTSGESLVITSLGAGGFIIDTGVIQNFIIKYKYSPKVVEHDVHLPTITSSYLHIPADCFIMSLYKTNEETIQIKDLKVRLKNIPQNWEVLTTCVQTSDGFILLEDSNALINAGTYGKSEIKLQEGTITIAVDSESNFDVQPILKDLKTIFNSFYNVFEMMPNSDILVVINQSRKEPKENLVNASGQAKDYNFVIEYLGINRENQDRYKTFLLTNIAHEGFHFWLPFAFNVKDDWGWFWEGVTDYQSYRILAKAGVISKKDFESEGLSQWIKAYHRNQYKGEVSLYDISTKYGNFSKYSGLLYDKGALVAYLLDQELQKQNKDIDEFLMELYQEYGANKIPLGNDELISFLNKSLGDSSFTDKYILETDMVAKYSVGFCFEYYYRLIKNPYLPPVKFPFDIIIPLLVLSVVGFIGYFLIKKILKKIARSA